MSLLNYSIKVWTKIICRKIHKQRKDGYSMKNQKNIWKLKIIQKKKKSVKIWKRDPPESQYEISLKHFKTPNNPLYSYGDNRELDHVEDKDLITSESDTLNSWKTF